MTTPGDPALPGWRPDPVSSEHLRFWDGEGWTELQLPIAHPPTAE